MALNLTLYLEVSGYLTWTDIARFAASCHACAEEGAQVYPLQHIGSHLRELQHQEETLQLLRETIDDIHHRIFREIGDMDDLISFAVELFRGEIVDRGLELSGPAPDSDDSSDEEELPEGFTDSE